MIPERNSSEMAQFQVRMPWIEGHFYDAATALSAIHGGEAQTKAPAGAFYACF